MNEASEGGYEAYETTSQVYDDTREAIGVEIILGCLAALGRPLGELKLLDAGCGTGNYSAALADHVGALVCLDRSEGMLARARAKLGARARVRFLQGDVVDVPRDAGPFAGVMMNQVAHHLEDPGDAERYERYERFAAFVANAFAAIEPGGVLSINTVSREQILDGYWWASLIPEAIAQVSRRFPPLATIEEIMVDAGFTAPRRYVPLDAVLQGSAYLDPRGPLDPTWRAGDSTWALASEQELTAALARMRGLLEDDGAQAFLAKREALRQQIGQTTFVIANKRG